MLNFLSFEGHKPLKKHTIHSLEEKFIQIC